MGNQALRVKRQVDCKGGAANASSCSCGREPIWSLSLWMTGASKRPTSLLWTLVVSVESENIVISVLTGGRPQSCPPYALLVMTRISWAASRTCIWQNHCQARQLMLAAACAARWVMLVVTRREVLNLQVLAKQAQGYSWCGLDVRSLCPWPLPPCASCEADAWPNPCCCSFEA